MKKKYSFKFWIIFWTISTIFLSGWYAFWEFRNQGIKSIIPILEYIPFSNGQGKDYENAAKIADYILKKDGKEKIFLILFQNNLELRPGGGFIGAFGILKIMDGEVTSITTHDLSNFDGRIPDGIEPPFPMQQTLGIKSWKMRDSNYSPDFEVNAKKAEEFYYLGDGKENFNGVIGITTNVFSSILKVTGPIQLADYPGNYTSENGVITLEYQVEKAFEEQGIERGERKSIMTELAEEIENKVFAMDANAKVELAKEIINSLNMKEIQLYFENSEMQKITLNAGWAGKVKEDWNKDYLMIVDANLGAFKSDYYINRKVAYEIDLSKEQPTISLNISYNHTAKQKDWMTRDYLSYLRIFIPEGAWLTDSNNIDSLQFGNEFGKKFIGGVVKIPIGQEKVVSFSYVLPKKYSVEYYDLLIQKQSGVLDTPYDVFVIEKDGRKTEKSFRINSDIMLSDLEK